MAGNRHHIIPRFLQKGFVSRIIKHKKDAIVFTWHYMKNNALPNTDFSTKDTIVSEYFYGRQGETNADDEITKLEEVKFSPLVNKLRDGSCDPNESKTEVAQLVAHLSVRTKVIRKGFEQMSGKMFEGIGNILTNDETVSNLILTPDKEQIGEVFDEAPNSSSPKMDSTLEIFQIFGLENKDVKDFMTELNLLTRGNVGTHHKIIL